MPNTLTQLEYMATDFLKAGIAEAIVQESPFMAKLPFMSINGNSLKYNIETKLGGATWLGVNDTIPEVPPEWTQRSAELSILINDADIDNFIMTTRTEQNIESAVIEKAAKGIAYEFEKQAILGLTSAASNTLSMKGLLRLVAECESSSTTDLDGVNNDQVVVSHATSGALSLDHLDELIDVVKPKPDALIMSRRMRRKLNSLARASGTNLGVTQNEWGKFIALYNELPIYICDNIPDNVQNGSSSVLDIASYDPTITRAADYDNSVIFAVRFGEDALCGLTNGGIQIETIGPVQNKDATRYRIKFYCGMANFSTLAIGALINTLDTALT